MHIYVFYAVRAFYSIFIIITIVQKNGGGHIQELCIYTVLICNDILLFTSRKKIP